MKLNLAKLSRKVQVFTTENSPTILTAIGVTGALTGAYLTGKATIKAVEIVAIDDAERLHTRRPQATKKDTVKLLWKLYIPAAGVLTLTCGSIVCANRIGMRRTATAAAAAALAERGWDEYKQTVADTIGKQKEAQVREKIAQKRVEETTERRGYPVIISSGKVLLHDEYTNQFFEGTINQVDAAVNEANREIASRFEGSISVSDFYDLIGSGGPEHTSMTDEMGWNEKELLKIVWETVPGPTPSHPAAHSYEFKSRPQLRPWGNAPFRG